MKVFELREKTRPELIDYLASLRKDLFNLKVNRATHELPNPLRLRTLHRELARVMTILTEDEKGIKKLLEAKSKKEKEKGKKDAKATDRHSDK